MARRRHTSPLVRIEMIVERKKKKKAMWEDGEEEEEGAAKKRGRRLSDVVAGKMVAREMVTRIAMIAASDGVSFVMPLCSRPSSRTRLGREWKTLSIESTAESLG